MTTIVVDCVLGSLRTAELHDCSDHPALQDVWWLTTRDSESCTCASVTLTESALDKVAVEWCKMRGIADVLTERGYTVTSNEHYVELARRARYTRASQSATRPTRRHRAD